jgi:hypothetical protein
MPMIRVTEPTMRLIREIARPGLQFHWAARQLDDGMWSIPVDDEAAFNIAKERRSGESDNDVVLRQVSGR